MAHLAYFLYLLAAAADFSGTWKMDSARSESAHQAVPIGSVVLVIRQSPTGMTVETRRTEAGKTEVQTETLSYLLNGSEITTTIRDLPVKTKAHWDGPKLVTETERIVNGASVTTRYIHSLAAGGKELKVEKTLMVQHGYQSTDGAKNYGTGVDIFVKSAK